jgi:hypothetical protein
MTAAAGQGEGESQAQSGSTPSPGQAQDPTPSSRWSWDRLRQRLGELLPSDRRHLAEDRAARRRHGDDGSIVQMSYLTTCAVGVWLVIVGTVSVVGLVWMWTVAERLGAGQNDVSVPLRTVRWFGPDFRATESTAVIVLVVFAAVAGSVVHMVPVFSMRAGRWTLEHGFGWWYLLRPFAAAALGPLFYMVIRGGLFAFNAGEADPDLPVLVLSGGLAGLFTDRVTQQLLALLGSTDPAQPASDQPVPHGGWDGAEGD